MKKYKIVVLSNLDNSSKSILKSAVNFAQMINGEIEVFTVKKPVEIVNSENQLSAVRSIHSERNNMNKQMQKIVSDLAEEFGVRIKYSLAIGNVKNEIADFLEEKQPDIVVLGKKKSKIFKLVSDNVAQYVFDIFKGVILISDGKIVLKPNEEVSLGTLNNKASAINLEFADSLMQHAQVPLKTFNIVKKSKDLEKVLEPAGKKKVDYVFEQNASSLKTLSKYLTKNNIDLLCVDRIKSNSENANAKIKDIMNKLEVSILVTGEE